MGSLKIRKGDEVKVISGKDRGKTGRVLSVEPKRNRVFVEGVNMTTRHRRARTIRDAQQASEGVTHQPGPVHISNVMLLDGKGNATRVGIKRENGVRTRVARKSGEDID
jgi:large subunit ribosomal protein L24